MLFTVVQYLSEWPKGNTMIIKLVAKGFFHAFSCTTQCVHNERGKKAH